LQLPPKANATTSILVKPSAETGCDPLNFMAMMIFSIANTTFTPLSESTPSKAHLCLLKQLDIAYKAHHTLHKNLISNRYLKFLTRPYFPPYLPLTYTSLTYHTQ